ncbi:VOC family protein [Micromonospora humi]|uniref:Glyoxalase-like domain-containing protein n=1 Tax=Micromonospora humi TaxID=745366 RepID=A0A1C5JE37_9ACTN|nr:VOC family protein [Micromonospora humi]SCG68830.1 Glyoxalase-like domain-containing protein [Micromonospora humi]
MTIDLFAISVDAWEPQRLAGFWAGLLGREPADDPRDGLTLPPDGEAGLRIRFLPAQTPKVGQNRVHLDLTSATSQGQRETVARAIELGGRHADIGQRGDEGHVVLADGEGNEFCVLEAGNTFLAGCGFVGAVNCDGSQAVGYFWHEALGWPLVWDQDEETAIQSPRGGAKITWSGPPLLPRHGRDRIHLDVAPPAGGDREAEVDRLLALGATRVGTGRHAADDVVVADPDGNEFCVLTPR